MTSPKPPSYVGSVRLIFEAGTKLEAKPQTSATAATYFHRFFQECSQEDYDFYVSTAVLRLQSAYPKSDPLPLAEEYWCLRDAIVQCELLMLRVLQFKVSVDHPHRVAWSLLCDAYLQPACLRHPPQELAVAVLQVALLAYDVRVPHGEDSVLSWYETLCESLSRERLADLIMDVIQVYDAEQ
ncbi:hypothetical protein HPB48_026616 [Haemaphysalis longicornis]|uniref:Cyclin N-terminal domain-containing protein n=1 Tax=Haemaphysalis longicornis TaxID=44386 RepID=A0A9J6HCM4_HAELO|nr:hypothetical protein HPB48_026616 [Haemaphysalis longicornis]